MTLDAHVAGCIAQLEARHAAREQALTISRRLIRQCANTIRTTHRANYDEAALMLDEARQIADELHAAVAAYPALHMAGYSQDALKEYAEAALVYAFLVGTAPPGPAELQMTPAAYLNGMVEAASELRRAILDRLRRNDVLESEALLATMDDVYSLMITVDFPDAITSGLRRSTDALRAVLERTRGDVTAALRQERLLESLAAVEQRLAADPEHPH